MNQSTPKEINEAIARLAVKRAAARYDVHKQTIWRWVQEGKFPKPVKVDGSTRWKLSDIESWEAEQGVA